MSSSWFIGSTTNIAQIWVRIANGPWQPVNGGAMTPIGILPPIPNPPSYPFAPGTHGGALMGGLAAIGANTVDPDPDTAIPKVSYEEVTSDMPILAHRAALIGFSHRGLHLRALNYSEPFQVDMDAICRSNDSYGLGTWSLYGTTAAPKAPYGHRAPHLDCNCGFYACPGDLESWANDGSVDVLVELSGYVIEHEKGYRAEHQRIYGIVVPRCPLCRNPSELVVIRHGQSTRWGCQECFGHVKSKGTHGPVIMREKLEKAIDYAPWSDADA
jgi:hypothetical protein